jgi:hypothetical protein
MKFPPGISATEALHREGDMSKLESPETGLLMMFILNVTNMVVTICGDADSEEDKILDIVY